MSARVMCLLAAVLALPALAAAQSGVIRVSEGLSTPESVLHDPAADVYLVSNINGDPTGKDDNGFISRIAPDGTVQNLKWIDGEAADVTLNAPKGLALTADALLVADIDTIRVFDRQTGAARGEWPVPGATFMNDVSVGPDGVVWATDTGIVFENGAPVPTGTAALYRFSADGTPTAVARGDALHAPNGVVATPNGPSVVTYDAAEVLRVSGSDVTTLLTLPQGQLDGVVRLDDGSYLVSSWAAGAVFHARPTGEVSVAVPDVPAPADIGFDAGRRRVLIPQFSASVVVIAPFAP